MTSRSFFLFGIAFIQGHFAFAQTPSAPAFDVASVKIARGGPEANGYNHQISPLGLTALHISMGYCIRLAYGVQRSYELVGPVWIDPPTENLFDVTAKVDSPVSADQIKLMLRSLLAERFKLVAHRENRDMPAYALTVGPRRPALKVSNGATPMRIRPGKTPYELLCEHVSMEQFAQQLGPPMTSRPVVDKTNLKGYFDFQLDLARYILDAGTGKPMVDARGAVDTESATLRAVADQLGLVLKPVRAPVGVLVVDHVDKTPLPD